MPYMAEECRDPAGLFVGGVSTRSDIPDCICIHVSRAPTMGEMEAIRVALAGRDWRVTGKGKGDE